MPDPSNSSFIPKRGPAKKSRTATTKRVYLFTVISYVLLFSALLASGGMYFYKGVVQDDLSEEISLLNQQISTFSESNMQRVLEFNSRLEQAKSRLEVGVSIPALFAALEESTAQTVRIDSIELEREGDTRLVLEGDMQTDTFDSTLFQRRMYQENQTISAVEISEFSAANVEGGAGTDSAVAPSLTFSVVLDFPLSNIPFNPSMNLAPTTRGNFNDFISAPTSELGDTDSTDDQAADNNSSL